MTPVPMKFNQPPPDRKPSIPGAVILFLMIALLILGVIDLVIKAKGGTL